MERTPQDVRVDAVYRAMAAFKVGFTQRQQGPIETCHVSESEVLA